MSQKFASILIKKIAKSRIPLQVFRFKVTLIYAVYLRLYYPSDQSEIEMVKKKLMHGHIVPRFGP